MTSPSYALATLLTALGLLTACAATGHPAETPLPAVSTLNRKEALAAVVALEDARSDGAGRLEALAAHPEAEVRARALRALGRLPLLAHGASVTDALCLGLNDPESRVRSSAAFALGMRADPAASEALLAALGDGEDSVRATMVEAASKIGTPPLREAVLLALDDPSPRVRVEAAVGPHRWEVGEQTPEGPGDERVDAALVRVAKEQPAADQGTVEGQDVDVVWRALFSLQRRRSSAAREVFLERSRTEGHTLVRLFAVKGLAQIAADNQESDDELRAGLEHALLDADWRIVVEALGGLASAANPRSVDALERTLGHPSAHVRAAAFEALGYQDAGDRVSHLLERARVDRSSSVRGAALIAEARVRRAAMAPDLELKMTSKDPIIRAACARAAGQLPSELAVPYLDSLSRDHNLRVATTAIETLGEQPTPASRELLLDLLQGRDNGRRLAAVLALRANAHAEDLPALRRAFERSRGDIAVEVKFNCLVSAGEIGGEEALDLVRQGLDDPHPYVRQVAFEILERAGQAPAQAPELEWPGDNIARTGEKSAPNPVVEISTNRGLMTFELFADEAPVHVHNFLQLAADDHYDGLNFHRVVPDFVIQGGCYRGDGNGASPWQGDALRHEVGPRKYVRGSLGMPRNEDFESGGSQFFATHRPTPHLDGRYTIFGELRSGSAVLDAIEVGDVILDVRPIE